MGSPNISNLDAVHVVHFAPYTIVNASALLPQTDSSCAMEACSAYNTSLAFVLNELILWALENVRQTSIPNDNNEIVVHYAWKICIAGDMLEYLINFIKFKMCILTKQWIFYAPSRIYTTIQMRNIRFSICTIAHTIYFIGTTWCLPQMAEYSTFWIRWKWWAWYLSGLYFLAPKPL